jgi:vacuolar protein sorting-associated protein 51
LIEIRQLDGERQSLVYNHHHELIAASDTIRAVGDLTASSSKCTEFLHKMKTRADSLDSDLEKLRISFSDISRLVAEVTRDDESKN